MPKFDPDKYLKSDVKPSGFDPDKYLGSQPVEKKNLFQNDSKTILETLSTGSKPSQTQLDTSVPSVLTQKGATEYKEQVKSYVPPVQKPISKPKSLNEAVSNDESYIGAIWNQIPNSVSDFVGGLSKLVGKGAAQMYGKPVELLFDVVNKTSGQNIVNPIKEFTTDEKIESVGKFGEKAVKKLRTSASSEEYERKIQEGFDITDGVGLQDVKAIPVMLTRLVADAGLSIPTGGLSFVAQGYNQGLNEYDEAVKDIPKELRNDKARDIFAVLYGTVNGLADKIGLDFITKSKPVSDTVKKFILKEAVKQLAEKEVKNITSDVIENTISNIAKSTFNKVKTVGVKTLTGAAGESVTEPIQGGLSDGLKILTNKVSGNDVFDTDEIKKNFWKSRINDAAGGFLLGGTLGGALNSLKSSDSYIAERVAESTTPEQIQLLKEELVNSVDDNGNPLLDEEKINILNQAIDKYSAANQKLPAGLGTEKRAKVLQLISERDEIKASRDAAIQNINNVDEAIKPEAEGDLIIFENKEQQKNDEIREAISGNNYKYFQDEDGKFYKKLGSGKPEEITQDYFNLQNQDTELGDQLTKPKQDAVQVETAGQVPVQPEAQAGKEMEQGKPEAKPKVVTEEDKQVEEVKAKARYKRRIDNQDIFYAEGSTYWKALDLKNSKIGDDVEFTDKNGNSNRTKVKDIVDGKPVFENGKTFDDVSTGANITNEDAWIAKNHPELSFKPESVTEEGVQEEVTPEQYVQDLQDTKQSNPEEYWSVDDVSIDDAKKGTIIKEDGGYGLVSKAGDIKGVFKGLGSKAKNVADKILQKAVRLGGTKLDNFDTYLTKIYERNGFKVVSRIPFNEEFAPPGWNKAKHGTPDVVAMVYDPDNKLNIKEKSFTDYDKAIAYRDRYANKVKNTYPVKEAPKTVESEMAEMEKLFGDIFTPSAENKGVSITNKSAINEVKTKSKDTNRIKIVESAQKLLKTLQSVLPKFDIVIHDNEGSYNASMSEVNGLANSAGNFSYVKNQDGSYSGRIDINLDRANSRTVAHEVAHGIMLKAFGDNPPLFKNFRDKISKVLSETANKGLMDFANQYKGDVAYEEYLVELSAMLSEQKGKISPTSLQKIAAIINDIVSRITKGTFKPFEDIKNTNDIIDFFNSISESISKGEEVGLDTFNQLGVSGVVNVSGKVKSKSSIISGEIKRFPTHPNVKLTEDVKLSKFNDKTISLFESDRMTAGYISDIEGNPLYKFFGGVFYPIITGKWWASSNKMTADKLANNANKNRESDGYIYSSPMVGSEDQHMSNKDMLFTTIEFMKADVNNKKSKVKIGDVVDSLKRASNRAKVRDSGSIIQYVINNSKDVNELFNNLEYVLFQDGKTVLNNKGEIFLDTDGKPVPNFTFEARRQVVETLLGNTKVKEARFPSAGSIKDVANKFAEPITSKVKKIGDLVTVMRTKGELRTRVTPKSDPFYHKSYNHETYAVNPDGSLAEIEVFVLDGAYSMRDVFPALTKSTGGVFTWDEYFEKHSPMGEKFAEAQYNRTAKLSSASGKVTTGVPTSKAQLANVSSTTKALKDTYISNEKEIGKINALNIIDKAKRISEKNEYLNCDAFCTRLVNNKQFKSEFKEVPNDFDYENLDLNNLTDLENTLKEGDIIAFGDKGRVVHYATYIGDGKVIEIEEWGAKPREYSLKQNLYTYESIAHIYRDKSGFTIKELSEAYHKAKVDNTNPELVKAVETLLAPTSKAQLGTPDAIKQLISQAKSKGFSDNAIETFLKSKGFDVNEIRAQLGEPIAELKQDVKGKGAKAKRISFEDINDLVELGATYITESLDNLKDMTFSEFSTRLQDEYGQDIPEDIIRNIFKKSAAASKLGVRRTPERIGTGEGVSPSLKGVANETAALYQKQDYKEIQDKLDSMSEAEKNSLVGTLAKVTGQLNAEDNVGVLAAIDLINMYEANGDKEGAQRVFDIISKSATAFAQLLRQYGQLKSSTPQGYVSIVTKHMKDKYDIDLTDAQKKAVEKLYSDAKKAIDINTNALNDLADNLTDPNYDGDKGYKVWGESTVLLEDANRKLSDYIDSLKPATAQSLFQKLTSIVQGNLLSLKSLLLNPVANAAQAGIKLSNNEVANLLDFVLNVTLKTGRTKISGFDPLAIRLGSKAFVRGLAKANRMLIKGATDTDLAKIDVAGRLKPVEAWKSLYRSLRGKQAFDFVKTIENLAEGTIGTPANLALRLLPYGDLPRNEQVKIAKLIEIGRNKFGLKGKELEAFTLRPDPESLAEAELEGDKSTLQEPNKVYTFLNYIINSIDSKADDKFIKGLLSGIKFVVRGTIVPFLKTPINYAAKTIRFTNPIIPYSQATYHMIKAIQAAKNEKNPVKRESEIRRHQSKLTEYLGEAIIAQSIMSATLILIGNGLVTGDAPEDDKEKDLMFQSLGPNMINISGLKRLLTGEDSTYRPGDTAIAYNALGILGAQIGISSNTLTKKEKQNIREKKFVTTEGKPFYEEDKGFYLTSIVDMTANFPASLNFTLNQGFAQGTGSLLSSIQKNEYGKWSNQMVKTLVTGLNVPNTVYQSFKAGNEYYRNLYTEDQVKTWSNIVKERYGNIEGLPINYDMWGKPIKLTPEGSNPFVYHVLDIFRTQKILQNKNTYYVFDLYKKTGDVSVIPSSVKDIIKKEGGIYTKLTPEQESELQRIVGEERAKYLDGKRVGALSMKNYDPNNDSEKYWEKQAEKLKTSYELGLQRGKIRFQKEVLSKTKK